MDWYYGIATTPVIDSPDHRVAVVRHLVEAPSRDDGDERLQYLGCKNYIGPATPEWFDTVRYTIDRVGDIIVHIHWDNGRAITAWYRGPCEDDGFSFCFDDLYEMAHG